MTLSCAAKVSAPPVDMSLNSIRQRFFSTNISSNLRTISMLEEQLLEKLRSIHDDNLEKDLVTLGRIKNIKVVPDKKFVSFSIEVPSIAIQEKDKWKKQAEACALKLPWISTADISLTFPKLRNKSAKKLSALYGVSNVVAVSSCKGGVGKSTVAINLAYSLKKLGAKVGILDADIYGPSLPTMISPLDRTVKRSTTKENFISPIIHDGIHCMSFGFVNKKAAPGAGGSGAAVMRGAMATKIIDQLILGTDWGELDYLLVDMPPGTGDIQISLSQQMAITAAVIVTTPQKLSFIDVMKGLEMFENLKIPTAAVVENMKFFDCVHGTRHYPFGNGHLKEIMAKYPVANVFELPILEELSSCSDFGSPFVDKYADHNVSNIYSSLASSVVKEIVKIRHFASEAPQLVYDSKRGVVIRSFTNGSAQEVVFSCKTLREECRCALCIDEFTGVKTSKENISEDIRPISIQQRGNYAISVLWSDGHTSSLYTFSHLQSLLNNK